MSLNVYAFTCGHLTGELGHLMESGEGKIRLPIPAYLIEHPNGTALFDTGMHPDCQHDPAARLGSRLAGLFDFDYRPGEEIGARLDGDVDVFLPGQPAHLHERAREQLPELRRRIRRPHQRRTDEDGVRARKLSGGTLRASVHAALGDDDGVLVAGCACDQVELLLSVDAEGGEVPGIHPDDRSSERHRSLQLICVVGFDQGIQLELARVRE